ncbi:Srb5 protein [Saccharomycopsis crataegensis]|uniref:Mediator of RNA polymerase II transcription subunit 18 n=1 Tax=Saccharomycopsis crataegensis TaxID=43959 RepID=A0AAV5QLV2_9ASCO|nr:Srb5 protein [Saccharomycopsis crataegensis]
MVQELSLVSTINKKEFNFVINSLIALTGQKPRSLTNENIIYSPIINLKYLQSKQAINNSVNLNQIEQHLVKIRRSWQMYSPGKKNPNVVVNEILSNDNQLFMKKVGAGDVKLGERDTTNDGENQYSFQISDIPAAGKRKVSSQTIYEVNIKQSATALRSYMMNLGYVEKQRFLIKGLKFLYNGVVNIEIFQVFAIDATDGKTVVQIIDGSENWFLKAYVNVAKITDISLINKASSDLALLQKNVGNLIKLKIPDRGLMDSRINDNL